MARTVLHQRLQGEIDAVEGVRRRIDGVTAGLSDFRTTMAARLETVSHSVAQLQGGVSAVSNVSQKLDGVTQKIGELQSSIASTFGTVPSTAAQVASSLAQIHTAILAATGQQLPEPTPEAFECIRALNQVEDLVTDHDFQLAKNNEVLRGRWTDRPTQGCYENLQKLDPQLGERFEAVYRSFDSPDLSARAERYLELDQLRRDIVRRFGSSSPPRGNLRGRARARSRRK